jgi:hypothetical protein
MTTTEAIERLELAIWEARQTASRANIGRRSKSLANELAEKAAFHVDTLKWSAFRGYDDDFRIACRRLLSLLKRAEAIDPDCPASKRRCLEIRNALEAIQANDLCLAGATP